MSKHLKESAYHCLLELISNRINEAQSAIDEAVESRNNESKSTSGDKHEVGRAMAQIELDNQNQQLSKNLLLKEQLKKLSLERSTEEIGFGSLVETNKGIYFISIGHGVLIVEGQEIFVISLASPIGSLLNTKKLGEHILFNNQEITIQGIS